MSNMPNRIFIPTNINMFNSQSVSGTAWLNNSSIDLTEWIPFAVSRGFLKLPYTLVDGNTDNKNIVIGTNDNFDFSINTNGISRMIIKDDGRIGIATPAFVPSNTQFYLKGFGNSSATNTFVVHNSTGTSNSLIVRDDGKVGVGISSPSSSLHVGGAITISNGLGDRMITFNRYGGNQISIEHDTARMYFYNASTSAPLLNFANNGQISIGSFTPNGTDKLTVNGTISATNPNINVPSDRKIKKDIVPYQYGLDELIQINPVKFKYTKKAFESVDTDIEYVGIIAQDVESILPETICTFNVPLRNDEGEILFDKDNNMLETEMKTFKGNVDLTYILINAVKELTSRIEALEASLK